VETFCPECLILLDFSAAARLSRESGVNSLKISFFKRMEAGSCARTTKRCEMLLLPLDEWRCVGEHSSTGLNMLHPHLGCHRCDRG
jgi:hypothetical protein